MTQITGITTSASGRTLTIVIAFNQLRRDAVGSCRRTLPLQLSPEGLGVSPPSVGVVGSEEGVA